MALDADQTTAAIALFERGLLPSSVARRLGLSMTDVVIAWRTWQNT